MQPYLRSLCFILIESKHIKKSGINLKLKLFSRGNSADCNGENRLLLADQVKQTRNISGLPTLDIFIYIAEVRGHLTKHFFV